MRHLTVIEVLAATCTQNVKRKLTLVPSCFELVHNLSFLDRTKIHNSLTEVCITGNFTLTLCSHKQNNKQNNLLLNFAF